MSFGIRRQDEVLPRIDRFLKIVVSKEKHGQRQTNRRADSFNTVDRQLTVSALGGCKGGVGQSTFFTQTTCGHIKNPRNLLYSSQRIKHLTHTSFVKN